MSDIRIGDRVRDRVVGDCGTIVGYEGGCWQIEWDRPTVYLGQFDIRPGKSPWFEILPRRP